MFIKFTSLKYQKLKNRILQALKIYLFTWLSCILFFLYFTFSRAENLLELISWFLSIATRTNGLIIIHVLFLLFYILFRSIKYYITVYKTKGSKIAFKQFLIRFLLPIFLLVIIIKGFIYYNQNENFDYKWYYEAENKNNKTKKRFLVDGKIRGMNAFNVGRRKNLQTSEYLKSNIEWIAVIPYFYQETENSKKIETPDEIGNWSRRDSGFIKDIKILKDKDFFVMIKPHLWMSEGWRSNINFKVESDWDSWFENYRTNMIHYAEMAQKTNADLFCIGTELKSSLKQQPQKWLALIREIKSVYKGKITYAANWDDDLSFTEFWNEMDYIGVQAYYPLTKNSSPNLEEIKNGWNKHIVHLKEISERFNKQILFTEIGYRTDTKATIKPWEWSNTFQRFIRKKSEETQQLAYEALFEKLWNEDFFAGLFPWEWTSSDFPIYKKPAQNTITIWYGK